MGLGYPQLADYFVGIISVGNKNIRFTDLDKDVDPDLLYYTIQNNIPVVWIDDDDDMNGTDMEGDTDSDCLLIDKNRDGKADIQLIVNNGDPLKRGGLTGQRTFMYVMDADKDNIMQYVDWNKILVMDWEHTGQANFYEDYHGNTTFLKMSSNTFRVEDLRCCLL